MNNNTEKYIAVKDLHMGWSILNTKNRSLVEGGFSSRQACEDYIRKEYSE